VGEETGTDARVLHPGERIRIDVVADPRAADAAPGRQSPR
jgi:hypothetical protein